MEEKQRIRKDGIKHGTRSQVQMTFRLDADLKAWLDRQPNKGRAINDAVRRAMIGGQ